MGGCVKLPPVLSCHLSTDDPLKSQYDTETSCSQLTIPQYDGNVTLDSNLSSTLSEKFSENYSAELSS